MEVNQNIENDKRYKERVNFRLDIFYPRINDKSIYQNYLLDNPLLEAVNLSEDGICFESRVYIAVGDFLSFLMKIDDNPSFWCLAYVKWVKVNMDRTYLVGCEFVTMSSEQYALIKKYVALK